VAAAALAGIDPKVWLRSESDIEVEYLRLVAEEAIHQAEINRKNLATHIINTLAKALDKGSKNQSRSSPGSSTSATSKYT